MREEGVKGDRKGKGKEELKGAGAMNKEGTNFVPLHQMVPLSPTCRILHGHPGDGLRCILSLNI